MENNNIIKTVLKPSSLPEPYFYASLVVLIGLGILFFFFFFPRGEKFIFSVYKIICTLFHEILAEVAEIFLFLKSNCF